MDAKGKPIGAEVAAISWYDGAEGTADAHAPTLAIALTNGLVQLARSIDDANPVVIDTQVYMCGVLNVCGVCVYSILCVNCVCTACLVYSVRGWRGRKSESLKGE